MSPRLPKISSRQVSSQSGCRRLCSSYLCFTILCAYMFLFLQASIWDFTSELRKPWRVNCIGGLRWKSEQRAWRKAHDRNAGDCIPKVWTITISRHLAQLEHVKVWQIDASKAFQAVMAWPCCVSFPEVNSKLECRPDCIQHARHASSRCSPSPKKKRRVVWSDWEHSQSQVKQLARDINQDRVKEVGSLIYSKPIRKASWATAIGYYCILSARFSI